MKIQKILSLCLAFALTFAFSNAVQAQSENSRKATEKQEIKMEKSVNAKSAEQAPKEQMEKPMKRTPEDRAKAEMKRDQNNGQKAKAKKGNKGKAYGRHKEGHEGKAHGQQRAADAKAKEKGDKGKDLKKGKAKLEKSSLERR